MSATLPYKHCDVSRFAVKLTGDDAEQYSEKDKLLSARMHKDSGMTAQMCAAIQRVYCIGKPPKATKAALLLSSGVAGSTGGAIATYKGMVSFMGLEDVGVCELSGDENKSEEKLAAIRDFAAKR